MFFSEIPGPTRSYEVDEEDYNDQLGSAETDQEGEFSNNAQVNGKSLWLSTLEPPKKSTHSSERSNHVVENGVSRPDCKRTYVRLFLIAWLIVIHKFNNLGI